MIPRDPDWPIRAFAAGVIIGISLATAAGWFFLGRTLFHG